ncbi:efflux RND transporter periplasmic adaptor subunit [Microbulbifer sp. MLAF003]|uniref:efflux RND transporter periplasmic adaptor subunit n=1 Tax=unclassified Microbulbifer TaxID=2619833 RepID=UPI0024AD2033|nr:HlyD family efflux transporter periplasmic adaptor subunit [Microbulbifer sp. MLAF003]WHI53195.1 efflux RND transporter periplasmic adaptor subunit [Microbulbifer sp. MLAF003]
MDILKPKKRPLIKHPLMLGGAALAFVAFTSTLLLLPDSAYKVEREQLMLGTVQRGDLQVVVDGYGRLRSDKQTLITALTAANVEKIMLRPGAEVQSDSIIMQLSNPELMRDLDAAETSLEQEEANLRRLVLNNQRDVLAEEAILAELNSNYQVIKLRREAEDELVKSGVVSQLTYQTTVLRQEQMKKRVDLQKQRINHLRKVAVESELIQREQINQAQTQLQSIQQRTDRLTVRAGLDGILQRLPVELGQGVDPGQELALIGSETDLLALVQVPQSKAEQLEVGQPAEIDTRREKVEGVVTRITPEVRDGNIEVEIAFSAGAPESARPQLNVDARIFTATMEDTLFVERPINVQRHSETNLFLINENGEEAALQPISFGEESGRYIQITQGVNEADRIILSDMANFNEAEHIQIID